MFVQIPILIGTQEMIQFLPKLHKEMYALISDRMNEQSKYRNPLAHVCQVLINKYQKTFSIKMIIM